MSMVAQNQAVENRRGDPLLSRVGFLKLGLVKYCALPTYTLRRPVMGEVLSTRIWGVPPSGGPLL